MQNNQTYSAALAPSGAGGVVSEQRRGLDEDFTSLCLHTLYWSVETDGGKPSL